MYPQEDNICENNNVLKNNENLMARTILRILLFIVNYGLSLIFNYSSKPFKQ